MSGEKSEDDLIDDPEALAMEDAGLDDPTDEVEVRPFGVTGGQGESHFTPEKAFFVRDGDVARIDIVSEAKSIRADTRSDDAVGARIIAGDKLDQIQGGEFNLSNVNTGRLPSSSVILELPVDKLPPRARAVQASTRRQFAYILAGIGALSAASFAGTVGLAKLLENLTESASHHQTDSAPETCDNSNELLADAEPEQCLEDETACEASPIEATTLYGKVVDVARSQEAVSTYTANQEIRLEAASTHQLMKEHFSNAHTWQDLDGRWQDTDRAFDLTVRNLNAWGYAEALDRLPSDIHSIDGMLGFIAQDDYFKHSETVARNIAIEIAMMDSPLIAADPAQVKADLAAISPDRIEKSVQNLVENPPSVPPSYTSPSHSLSAHASNSVYDAPEAPMHLKMAVKTADVTTAVTAPTPVLVEFEPEQIGAELPEPLYVDEVLELDPEDDEADLEEIVLDEGDEEDLGKYLVEEEEEPLPVLTPTQMGMSNAFDVPEAHAIQTKVTTVAPEPAKEPAKTLAEKATATVKGWASKIGGWFK